MNNQDIAKLSVTFQSEFPKRYGTRYTDAAALVMPNLVNGCHWELVVDNDRKDWVVDLDKDPSISVTKVANGYLVLLDFNELFSRINSVTPVLGDQLFNRASACRSKALEDFLKKINTHIKKTNGSALLVGLYNTNDTNTVTIDGKVYNAYNITYEDALGSLRSVGINASLSNPYVAPSGNSLMFELRF